MKLQLPKVTLIGLTGLYYQAKAHQKAIDKSCEGIEFGAVKIVMDQKITNVDEWNKAVIFDLWKYVDTEYAFLFHGDGYIINPDLWNPRWLELDYIGAPWPLPKDDYSYRTPDGELIRVGNSVSLRSKKIMALPSMLNLEWKPYYGNTNEDGYLCVHHRYILERYGCKFATLDQALNFSKEHEISENKDIKTFAFHEVNTP